MQTFTAGELQRKLGEVQDTALREPVIITRNGRERLVILAAEEFHRLKRRDRQALLVEDLPEEAVRALSLAEVPAKYDHLNAELEE